MPNIFILTPERTLKLLSDHPNLKIDFFFFDEVYKIDEDFNYDEDNINLINGSRAKAFRITLYLLSKLVPEFYLAGPYLNLEEIKDGLTKYIKKYNITPIQIDSESTLRIEINAWRKSSTYIHPVLGTGNLSLYSHGSPTTRDKINGIINYLEKNKLGQAIFYCSTPANSMRYIVELLKNFSEKPFDNKISKAFINHIKRKYGIQYGKINSANHWSLVNALENGVGIHHGKFPKYIQNEILRMFNNKDFDYLFCTSTIIEGVNTTAKNVVIINNSVGSTKMSAFTLKNIKGRAGRYYHNYVGRVFYTSAEQRKIEEEQEIHLNFPTYSNKLLLDVDIDSADKQDLTLNNQVKKDLREISFNYEKLPNEVFAKNRLFARDIQEKYLNYLLIEKNFNKFYSLIYNSNNIHSFLSKKMVNTILDTMEESGIIEANNAKVYHAVVLKYSTEGTRGIIKYHLTHADSFVVGHVDSAYIKAFNQIRNIVEYEVPKLLCLFEALYQQAGRLKGHNMDEFNMSAVIRFFELGVRTEFGLFLVEFGFPIDTIQALEKSLYHLSQYSAKDAIAYLQSNRESVEKLLDEYEMELFNRAIKTLENRN